MRRRIRRYARSWTREGDRCRPRSLRRRTAHSAVSRRRVLGRWGLGPKAEPSARRLAALAWHKPWRFRAAVILLIDDDYPATTAQFDMLSARGVLRYARQRRIRLAAQLLRGDGWPQIDDAGRSLGGPQKYAGDAAGPTVSCDRLRTGAGGQPAGSGLATVRSGNREKSRSADQSTRTPWYRQRAAIRASCTTAPCSRAGRAIRSRASR